VCRRSVPSGGPAVGGVQADRDGQAERCGQADRRARVSLPIAAHMRRTRLSFCWIREEAPRMTAEHAHGEEPLIPMPAPTLDALRHAVTAVVPSRLPEFSQEIQDAFSQAGDEDSVFPIRHFYQRWGATIAIERRPSVAARLPAAERALADPDADVRERAIQEAAEIVQPAYPRQPPGQGTFHC
jgi:hypothetical protein